VDDKRFVWPGFAIHSGDDRHEHQEHYDQDPGSDDHVHWQPEHKGPPLFESQPLAALSLVSRNSRLHKFVPTFYVGDSLLIFLDDNFRAFFDGDAIFAARAGAASATTERKDDFAGAIFANGHADLAKGTDDAAIFCLQRLIGRADELQEETKNHPTGSEPGEGGKEHDEERNDVRILRQQIACATEPREEGEDRGGIEPGNVHTAVRDTATRGSADCVAATVKWQVHFKRQVQMDGAGQK